MPAAVASRKKSSKNLVRTASTSIIPAGLGCGSPGASSGISPSRICVKNPMPTARTSASANGSVINGSGALLASARAAATIVAVAATLGARSPLSMSVRATVSSLPQYSADVDDITERLVGLAEFETVLGEQISRGTAGRLPAVGFQILGGFVAVAEIDELGHVEVETVLSPSVRDRLHAFLGGFRVDVVVAGDALGGEPAALRRERGAVVDQPGLC